MLDDVGGILRRLAASTGRTLLTYRQHDLEPVSDGIILGYACTVRGAAGAVAAAVPLDGCTK